MSRPRPNPKPGISARQARSLLNDEAVHQSFLKRPDIARLSKHAQQKRWEEHLVHLNNFWNMLSDIRFLTVHHE